MSLTAPITPPPARQHSRRYSALIPVVGLLLIYVVSRLHDVLAMPPFIDEFLHIQWAQDVYSGHFFTGAANGRLLALWWMSLFQLHGDGLLWITRTVTLLFSMIAVSVVYSQSRVLASRWAGVLAAVFYILAPFTFFHERLGLSDAYVSTLGVLALWFAVRYALQRRDLDAILSGLIVTASIVVKATGVMLVFLPAIALITLIPLARWRQIVRGGILAYAALTVTGLPFYLFLKWRGWSYFGVAVTVVGTDNTSGIVQRVIGNIGLAWAMDSAYLSVAIVILFCVLAVYMIIRRWRIGLFVALTTLIPLAALMAFATKVSGRYILIHIPTLMVCLGAGLAVLAADLSRRGGLTRAAALAFTAAVPILWGVLFALPFQAQMRTDPASVMLPSGEWGEYVEGDSSGYALDQAAAYLIKTAAQDKQTIHVVGLVANCGGLNLQIPTKSGVTVECPYITYTGSEQKALAALVNKRAAESSNSELWIASENSPYITLEGITAPYDKVITFDRPGGVSQVSLYRVRSAS